jgi:hypothetical protein
MNESADNPIPPPVELTDADERALDALLIEAFRSPAEQRDFTDAILARLHQHHQSVCLPGRPLQAQPGYLSRTKWTIAAATVATLAATVLAIVTYRATNDRSMQIAQPSGEHDLTTNDLANNLGGATAAAGTDTHDATLESLLDEPAVASAAPQRRPPVLLSEGFSNWRSEAEPLNFESRGQLNDPLQIAATTSRSDRGDLNDFDRQFAAYWKAIGVTPAPPIERSAWLERIVARFGVQPIEESQDGSVKDAFSDLAASRALAERLVGQLFAGLKLSDQRRERWVEEATEVIYSGGRFDQLLSNWIADDSWLDDPAGGRSDAPAAKGEWFASRVIGADAGCARCHDSPIDSRYAQHDFWALAALFAPPSKPQLFYELTDGRQRVATAGVPMRWLGASQPEPSRQPDSRAELAELVIDNTQVARALANHLWTIGFGAPLVAAASTPLAPPRDDALDGALELLSAHLMDANFDVREAARWVIASDPMKRGAPAELVDDGWEAATEAKLAAASLAQRSFAAAEVTAPRANRNRLLAMMQSRSGLIPATLTAPDSLLAQTLTLGPQQKGQAGGSRRQTQSSQPRSGGAEANRAKQDEYWWSQWLADRDGLRGGWLASIRDPDQQLRHAFYAAGYRDINREQLEKTETLLAATEQSKQDRDETVAQIHWILHHAK